MTKKNEPFKNDFRVRLSDCGQRVFSNSYKLITDQNAEKLLWRAIVFIAKDLVGEENMTELIFDTILDITNDVIKPEVKETYRIQDDWKNLEKKIKHWEMKDQKEIKETLDKVMKKAKEPGDKD